MPSSTLALAVATLAATGSALAASDDCAPPASMAPSSMVLLASMPSAASASAATGPPVTPATPAARLLGGPAVAPSLTPAQTHPQLEPSARLRPASREPARRGPIVLQAQTLESRPDRDLDAQGNVEFRQGGLVIRADRIRYDNLTDRARAEGQVRIARDGAVYSGPLLELTLGRFEGFFLGPRFELPLLGASGSATRIDFLGEGRSRATDARYTSCPVPAEGEPDWLLKAREVRLDFGINEGIADGAQLRFKGVPILALPSLSFPIDDSRKTGWLPPSINIDNRSGFGLSVPWYWNIAPNLDATLAPRLYSRRGFGLDTEFRYLTAAHEGALRLDALPKDQVARRSRGSLQWQHQSALALGMRAEFDVVRVSDRDWWKDFPDSSRSFTPRLLGARAALERNFEALGGEALAYARVLRWQVLQDAESFITAPYERSPQLGLAWQARIGGLEWALETEYNRFTLPLGQAEALDRPTGERWHSRGSVARPWRGEGWFFVPRLSLNAVAYDNTERGPDGFVRGRRSIPSFSVDMGLELERRTQAFGRLLEQTLEPRVLFVKTPYREQSGLPNYDSAAKDFNIVSLFTDNAFSGYDRVSDAQQLTAGFTTRLVDVASGAEALRLGLVQRVLFAPQRVAPGADGLADGPALDQRFSDALLVGSTSVLPGWTLDAAVQYSPDIQRSVRSILGARYSPGPFRTVSATYRLARGLSEQLEVGWQWPLFGADRSAAPSATGGSSACRGAWYSVGRINYSLRDRRVTDSILGLEYDAGCWIARIVTEQLSTGRSQATTRILLQLELVGLSRLGSNPLKVLRDNVPGYRLLRDEPSGGTRADPGPTP
jgi:LPS-assembly protein